MPTPVADLIYAKLRGALGSVRQSVAERRGFDPKTSERKFFVGIAHPLGPMIAVRLRERLARAAPGVEVGVQHAIAADRARARNARGALRRRRRLAAARARSVSRGHALWRRARRGCAQRSPRTAADAIGERPAEGRVRVAASTRRGRAPVAGIREWRRLALNYVLEVSEILEVFMVVGQSELFGLIP